MMHTIGEKRIRMLNPRNIKRQQFAVRKDFDLNKLNLLRDSIAASGVLQPILVRRLKKGTYQLISGSRRLQAALMAGLRRVPCVIHNANDDTAVLYSLAENIGSQALSFFDEAAAIDYLLSKKRWSYSQVSAYLGISQTELNRKLQVLRLDERLAKRISEAGLSESHALALLNLPKECRGMALQKIIDEDLSSAKAEKYIFSILNPPIVKEEEEQPTPEKAVRKFSIGDTKMFSNSLVKLVDTLRAGGVTVNFRKSESDTHTEYKIRIKKVTTDSEEPLQLKICQ